MPLLSVSLREPVTPEQARSFPFSVPAIRRLPELDLRDPITFLVGENGSGKSTLLEAMASAAELQTLGSIDLANDISLAKQRELGRALRLAWRPRSRQGFFLRAEDFFGHARFMARAHARYHRERRESAGAAPRTYDNLPGGLHSDEVEAAEHLPGYDSRSHGETYVDLFSTKLKPGGLYLLDEPEAPLSPTRQVEVLRLLRKAASAGAQLVIATHSPILLACPGARIYSFDELPVAEVIYDLLPHVSVMRSFLDDPDAYLAREDAREAGRSDG
ncbi:MAG: ATPase [Labilithrix sp.]|nr:ATPase [Labilithrix sp.]